MTSEFGKMRNVIVTPEMLKHYFSMTKTEILAHLFLLSVCDEDRHIKRNVRALGRETEKGHAGVYSAIMGLKLKKMLEEKRLKTKGLPKSVANGSRYWRVYPLPRTREGKEKAKQNSQPNVKEAANPDILPKESLTLRNGVGTVGELIESVAINQQTMPEKTELKWKKGFLKRALKRIRLAR